jgi:hypothetical protein
MSKLRKIVGINFDISIQLKSIAISAIFSTQGSTRRDYCILLPRHTRSIEAQRSSSKQEPASSKEQNAPNVRLVTQLCIEYRVERPARMTHHVIPNRRQRKSALRQWLVSLRLQKHAAIAYPCHLNRLSPATVLAGTVQRPPHKRGYLCVQPRD